MREREKPTFILYFLSFAFLWPDCFGGERVKMWSFFSSSGEFNQQGAVHLQYHGTRAAFASRIPHSVKQMMWEYQTLKAAAPPKVKIFGACLFKASKLFLTCLYMPDFRGRLCAVRSDTRNCLHWFWFQHLSLIIWAFLYSCVRQNVSVEKSSSNLMPRAVSRDS